MVSDVYYPHPGGVSEHIYHASRELMKRGHSVTIMAPHMDGDDDVGRLPSVVRVGRGMPILANRSHSRIAVAWNIEKLVENVVTGGFDIIHMHGFVPVLPLLALKYSNAKNIVTIHAAYEKNFAYSVSRGWLRRYARKLDARIAVSSVAEKSISMFFPGRYIIIPNGVDINRFKPEIESLPELEGRFNILFVGRFESRKGLKYLLSAFPMIKREVPDARLVVVGSGGFEVPQKYINDIILRKSVPPSLIPQFYASSDVFCSPATGNESFGIVLLEAMASGVPVVASSIPGYRCVIKDDSTGILVERENPRAIASAIIKLAGDRDLREKMGKRGREYAIGFSWERITHKIETVYKLLFR